MATLDGELIELAQRIELRVHPKGLLVVVPTRATVAANANAATTEAQ